MCTLCPTKALEAHHALTCKRGSDVIARHNHLRDTLHQLFKKALYSPKLEAGSGLGHDQKQSRLADILVNNWGINGKLVTPLKPDIVSEAGHTAGSTAFAASCKKIWVYVKNLAGATCHLLNASNTFSKLASYLSVQA